MPRQPRSTPSAPGSPGAMHGKRPEDVAAGALALSLLRETVALGARRLHLEPAPGGGLTARMRGGGLLRPGPCPPVPADLAHLLLRQLKARAGMDPGEARIPQEGRMVLQRPAPDTPVTLRLSTLPTTRGEAMLVEVAADLVAPRQLGELGLDPSDLARVLGALTRGGLVLAVGPTNAGKGTFLRACVRHAAQDPDRTVFSLDPEAEHDVPGAVTIRLNPEVNVHQENMLCAVLTMADPDVVHLPRITCWSEADRAVEAAAMGRLLLAGFGTEDAPSAVVRLVDMGVPSYLVTASLQAVVSCRTLPRLCDGCKVPAPALDPDDLVRIAPRLVEEELLRGWEHAFAPRRGGCDACAGTGHMGRLGVYEVVDRPAPLIDAVVRDPGAGSWREALAARLHERTRTLRESALLRAAAGLVSVVEALRRTPNAPGGEAPRARCA